MNIEITETNGKPALVNWNNVTTVTQPENYLMGQIGDTGPCLQINFTSSTDVLYTKETIEDIKNEPNGFYRLYFCIGWEITELSINKNLHNSLDDFLMDLNLKKNDLYFLKSQVGDISKLTEYGTEIYFRNRKDTYYYAAYDSDGYLEEEWEEEFSY